MSVANRPQSMEKHNKARLTSTKLPQSPGAPFRPTGALFEKNDLLVFLKYTPGGRDKKKRADCTSTSDPLGENTTTHARAPRNYISQLNVSRRGDVVSLHRNLLMQNKFHESTTHNTVRDTVKAFRWPAMKRKDPSSLVLGCFDRMRKRSKMFTCTLAQAIAALGHTPLGE
jgi:hypothetical protein